MRIKVRLLNSQGLKAFEFFIELASVTEAPSAIDIYQARYEFDHIIYHQPISATAVYQKVGGI